MNGRALLFSRCLIGLLAYFLCGLVYGAALYQYSTSEVTGDPVGFSYSKVAVYNLKDRVLKGNTCSDKVPIGGSCVVTVGGYLNNSSQNFGYSFTRIKEPLCQEKKDKPAGDQYIPLPGSGIGSDGLPLLIDKSGFRDFMKGGSISCDGTCEMTADGNYQTEEGKNLWTFDGSGSAWGLISMKYTGQECTLDPNKKPPTKNPSNPNPNKNPNGPADCPPKTTYGEVNGVKTCVKNAPLPTDPSPPPKPSDKDTCLSNCSKWDPDKDTKPTDPKDPNKPTDPSTGGSTPPTKGPLSSDASKPSSENASGPADSSLAASCTDFKCKNKDPATCEIARLAWNNKCIDEKAAEDLLKSDLYKTGNSAMSTEGLDDMKKSLNFGENGTVDMAGVIKRDTFLNKGGLSDVSFTVMGKGFSLPFSSMNKYLSMMGKIAVAFSLLAAARILSSAV